MRRGPKAASANLGAQVGMAHTGVSNTGLCRNLLSTNTPAPSKTSMQASANKVGKSIIQANQKDMAQIKKDLKAVTPARGLSERTGIDVEVDCRYSNPIHSGECDTISASHTGHTTCGGKCDEHQENHSYHKQE